MAQINVINWSWTETSKTVSQNNPVLFLNWISSGTCYSNGKKTNMHIDKKKNPDHIPVRLVFSLFIYLIRCNGKVEKNSKVICRGLKAFVFA
jgi:hypothetical protein